MRCREALSHTPGEGTGDQPEEPGWEEWALAGRAWWGREAGGLLFRLVAGTLAGHSWQALPCFLPLEGCP